MDPQIRELFVPGAAFAFGACIGSFLNVVIYRLPRAEEGLTIAYPRLSLCPQCKATIHGYDNIPLLSYFVLAGKCRACRAPIPLRYFFVELLTATLFAYLAFRFAPAWGLLVAYAGFTAALISCTFIDIDLRIIPDKIDIPGMLLAPVAAGLVPALHRHGSELPGAGTFTDLELLMKLDFIASRVGPLSAIDPRLAAVASSLLGIAVGAGIIYAIGMTGDLVLAVLRRLKWTEKDESMGFGDVKLMGMIGGFVGVVGVLLALLIACVAGSVIGIVLKRITKDSYIPFGPFLALGALAVVLWRPEIVHFLTETYPKWVTGALASNAIGCSVVGYRNL